MSHFPVKSLAVQPSTAEAIQTFIVSLISEKLDINPDDIDIQAAFESFDLSSTEAMIIVSKLETWLGRSLSPTLMWNYPTIELLSIRLAEDANSSEFLSLAYIEDKED
jgi:acyl carrier protein